MKIENLKMVTNIILDTYKAILFQLMENFNKNYVYAHNENNKAIKTALIDGGYTEDNELVVSALKKEMKVKRSNSMIDLIITIVVIGFFCLCLLF